MLENNFNLFKKIFTGVNDKSPDKPIELIKSIIDANRDLKVANKNFESAEAELIDYYSYQIKANKAKLDYLIKEIKRKGIALDTIKALEVWLYKSEASGL